MKNALAILLSLIIGLSIVGSTANLALAQEEKTFFTLHLEGESATQSFLQYVAASLKEIGINVEIHTAEWTTIATKVKQSLTTGLYPTYEEGGWDMWYDSSVPPVPHPHSSLTYPEAYVKSLDFVDRTIWDLIYKAAAEANITKAKEIYYKVQELFLDNLPYVMLDFVQSPWIFSSKVANTAAAAKYYVTSPGDRVGIICRSTYDVSGGVYVPGEDTIVYCQSFRVPNFLSIFGWAFVEGLYLRLVTIDPTTLEVVPELAEFWEISPDGKTYTFHLRDGIVWSDGEPLKAWECKWTYEIQMNATVASVNYKDLTSWVDYMEAPDDKTFIIHLKQPVGFLLTWLATMYGYQIAPAHVLKDIPPDQLKTCDYNTKPGLAPVTGWVKPVEHVEGEYTKYERNDMLNTNYFKPIQNKYILFKIVPETAAAIAGAEAGTIHITYFGYATTQEYPSLKTNTKLKIENLTRVNMEMLRINPKHPILGNVMVRKAIAYAIDIKGYIGNYNNGFNIPASVPVFPLGPYYAKNLTGYTYNIEKAKECMEKAGYNYDWLVTPTTEFPYMLVAASVVGGIVVGGVITAAVLKLRKK